MKVSMAVVIIVIAGVVAAGGYYFFTREKVGEEGAPEHVTISGTIIYDDYEQGEISVGAYENVYLMPPGSVVGVEPLQQSVGAVSIWGPGAYSFQVPANLGVVWLAVINDANDDGVFDIDVEPAGRYAGNPVTVGTENIANVNITLQPGGLF